MELRWPVARVKRPLFVFLAVQSALLFWRLELLPVWGDEQFTLTAAGQPLGSLLEMVGRDIHPPLYFVLVHFWLKIPWPASPEAAARALSALFALASTVVIDRFWLTGLKQSTRFWFLALWTVSPCLLLYGRMARSYSLQLLLTCIVVRLAANLLQGPGGTIRVLCLSGWVACLLYVHYLPGIAAVGAVTLLFAWKSARRRQPGLLLRALVANIVTVLLYVPWLRVLYGGIERAAEARSVSPALGVAYSLFSFLVGETVPPWMLAVMIAVGPATLWLVCRGASQRPVWLGIVTPLALIAFAGASRWVSFPFVPARILYLLPFFLLLAVTGGEAHRRLRFVTFAGLLFVSVGSLSSYFKQRNFLNKAYLVPYPEIAAVINRSDAGKRSVMIVDRVNSDPWPLLAKLERDMYVVEVRPESSAEGLAKEIGRQAPETIWYFRNTHDPSRDSVHGRLERELRIARLVQRRSFVPYSPLDRRLMKLLGWRRQPEYYVELLEFRRRPEF